MVRKSCLLLRAFHSSARLATQTMYYYFYGRIVVLLRRGCTLKCCNDSAIIGELQEQYNKVRSCSRSVALQRPEQLMRVDLVCALTCSAATILFLVKLLPCDSAAIGEIIILFYSGRVTAVVLLLCANVECKAKRQIILRHARIYVDGPNRYS